MSSVNLRKRSTIIMVALILCLLSTVGWAGGLRLVYEKNAVDMFGNDLGFQSQNITNLNQLPSGSPWRDIFTAPVDSRNVLSYAIDISKLLSMPLTLTISDRNKVSNSGKDPNSGYKIELYKHVTQYSSADSKKFVFLHELGHVAMLNAYPPGYNFSGLSYGPDNLHYMDEILPNQNTAWVEGWANAFAAMKNNGKVFSLSMSSDTTLAFLKGNSFEEMNRNELFIAKNLYDVFATLPGGKDKAFTAISRTGPHYSLRDFVVGYLSLYPGDQISLAKILDKNSSGRMTMNDMLSYVNNGSNRVNRAFYDYLMGRNAAVASSSTSSGRTTRKSFWASIGGFFSNLFGGSKAGSAAIAAQEFLSGSGQASISIASDSDGTKALSPMPWFQGSASIPAAEVPRNSGRDIALAEEEYFRAFAEYNRVISEQSQNTAAVKAAQQKLQSTKAAIERLKKELYGSR